MNKVEKYVFNSDENRNIKKSRKNEIFEISTKSKDQNLSKSKSYCKF